MISDKVASIITKENDTLCLPVYQEGKQEVQINLLMASLLTVEQIAQVAGVTVAFVKKFQAGLPRS